MMARYSSGLLRNVVLLAAALLAVPGVLAADRYGGIEIGAKGVKASAIEIDGSGAAAQLKVLSLDKKTVDVTISRLKGKNFSDVKIEDVVETVKAFQAALTEELQVPAENIRVVASSGVPFADNFGDLVTALQEQAGAELSKIDAREEASLTTQALVPRDWRTRTLVIDVGSGNTKGGIFLTGEDSAEDFVSLEAPYGTATLSKAIDERAQADGKSRAEVAASTATELVGEPLRQQVSEHAELAERPQILFSGGSVWAAVTIIRPETALDPFPTIKASDLKTYVRLLAATPGAYPEVDFSRIADADVRKAAQADYDRIRGAAGAKAIFTPEELQAGAVLLNEVADVFEFDSKSVLFDRKAVTAWITAIITPEEVRGLLPAALGRVLPEAPLVEASEVTRFGGIEIGAKGIKVSAVEVVGQGEAAQLKVLSLDKQTVDVTISRLKGKNFSDVKIEDVAEIVKKFQAALKDQLEIPESNIQVVASSGVPFAENFGDLVAAVQDQTGMALSKIDAREEASLTNLALVPQDWRSQTLVLDIGSGNTKGGLFTDDSGTPETFLPVEVPFGTATLSKAVDEQAQADNKPRSEVLGAVTRAAVSEPLQAQLTSEPELGNRKVILFSGGSVWAAMTIMHPEKSLDPFPVIRASDLKAYAELLARASGQYPTVDMARVADPAARKAAQADYDRICGVGGSKAIFTPEELQTGAALLNEIADVMQFQSRVVLFDRKAVTAWITAIITPPELRGLLPTALGRTMPDLAAAAEPEPVTPVPVTTTPPVPPKPMPQSGTASPSPATSSRPGVTMTPPAKTVPVAPADPTLELVAPRGLSKPPAELLTELMFLPPGDAAETVTYTADFCRDVAVKCYERGQFQDALAFARHSLEIRPTPSTLYLKGLSELGLNLSDEAKLTAAQLQRAGGSTIDVVGPLRERLNGPRAVRLVQMIEGR